MTYLRPRFATALRTSWKFDPERERERERKREREERTEESGEIKVIGLEYPSGYLADLTLRTQLTKPLNYV